MGPSKYWIKLYHEILHDPKMGRLPDNLWRRTIELFLMAGELDQDGELPPVSDMAWTLRVSEQELEQELEALTASGLEIVTRTPNGWIVTRFADRQSAMSSAERVRRHRESKRKEEYYGEETEEQQDGNEGVTDRYTDSDIDSDIESTPTEAQAPAPVKPQTKKPKVKTAKASPATPKQQEARAMFAAVAAACQINWRIGTDEQKGALNLTEKKLRQDASATPADVGEFVAFWNAHDWRGRQGDAPEPHQIREEWGRFEEWRKNGKPPYNNGNGGKHGPNQRPGAATGPKRDTLSDEQRRLLEGYRRTDAP
jgi:hypothetical protein